MSREARSRPVLSRHRHRLRKRYAVLAASVLIPAIASATAWPTTAQAERGSVHSGLHFDQAALDTAAYERAAYDPQIHSDTDASTTAQDAIGGPAARPFFAAGSGLDRVRAEQCLTMAIYYEAATQPDDGQRAVAQVVLNRVAHPSFPNTVCGVVFQGSERNNGCQFTFACDGSLARRPMAFWWNRARRVADAALAGYVYAPVGLATHYHTLAVHPYWSDSLVPVIAIGAHRFYRWPGEAGQKAAFQVAYLGGEPAAAPRPKVFTPTPDSDPDPITLAHAYEARLPRTVPLQAAAAAPAPVYAAEVAARGGDALYRADNLPAGGALSPELQRSGQWLHRP